jgi:hypothetical protein
VFFFNLFSPPRASLKYSMDDDSLSEPSNYATPFARDQYKNSFRRFCGRMGLDFVASIFRALNKQIEASLEDGVVASTMSATGFVTFLDLASTTCAASAPLTVKPNVLDVSVAPEPRVRLVFEFILFFVVVGHALLVVDVRV